MTDRNLVILKFMESQTELALKFQDLRKFQEFRTNQNSFKSVPYPPSQTLVSKNSNPTNQHPSLVKRPLNTSFLRVCRCQNHNT